MKQQLSDKQSTILVLWHAEFRLNDNMFQLELSLLQWKFQNAVSIKNNISFCVKRRPNVGDLLGFHYKRCVLSGQTMKVNYNKGDNIVLPDV